MRKKKNEMKRNEAQETPTKKAEHTEKIKLVFGPRRQACRVALRCVGERESPTRVKERETGTVTQQGSSSSSSSKRTCSFWQAREQEQESGGRERLSTVTTVKNRSSRRRSCSDVDFCTSVFIFTVGRAATPSCYGLRV